MSFPDGRVEKGTLGFGELTLLPLASDQRAKMTLHPDKHVNVGMGAGNPITKDVLGGVVGLLLDGRGRPLRLPSEQAARAKALMQWYQAVGLYPAASAES